MSGKYSVSLQKIINDNGYEVLYVPKSPADIYISSKDIIRPRIILTPKGFKSSVLRKWDI